MIYLLFILGFLVRLVLVPHPGFSADVAYWKGWSLAIADKGLLWLVQNTNYNYPPGFGYVLFAIGKIYPIFKSPYNISEYWLDTNLLYLFLIKGLTVLSDIAIVVLIIKICQKLNSKLGIFLSLLYFLSPASIFNGAFWGQVDQYGLMLFLLSFYLILEKRPQLASIVFTFSTLSKFQNMIFIPLFFLYIYKKFTFEDVIKSLKWSFLTFVVVNFPFFLTKQIGSLIYLLTVNADWFPHMSLNAFNIWWIFSSANGMGVSDKNLIIGVVNAKQLGLYIFIITYFIASITLFFAEENSVDKKFLVGVAFAIFSFFQVMTQSHERYAFHLMGFLPLLLIFSTKKNRVYNLAFFLIFSIFFFFNMYLSFYLNYPAYVVWKSDRGVTVAATYIVSAVQIFLYLYFFSYFLGRDILRLAKYIVPFTLLMLFAILGKNMNYILKRPIELAALAPIAYGQEYLRPVNNMTVDSAQGPSKWNRLSDNYFFYERGIGAHAQSSIDYRINGKFRKFETEFGMDTEADVEGKAVFAVEADGREIFRSKEKGRFDLPGHVELDITGAKLLTLKIYKVGDSIKGAHADWLGAVLFR